MATTISYIIPTFNRPGELQRTLERLGLMGPHEAEVIVVDNASVTRPHVPARLSSGVPVSLLARPSNDGAAGRNAGARVAGGRWLVMLDDDSSPTCTADELLGALDGQPDNVGAVMADIRLAGSGGREAGGLPEVFIGCGVAIRREVFVGLGGYDAAFGYYAEEYDLAARMILEGLRVVFEPGVGVEHRKVAAGRDMDLILGRLVRNNAWVMQRYAPEADRRPEIRQIRRRYRSIAGKEGALAGFGRGLGELRRTLGGQARRAMSEAQFARFTGLHAARQALEVALGPGVGGGSDRARRVGTASIIEPGKNEGVVRRALEERGVRVLASADAIRSADVRVIGTMSPGPMIDAAMRHAGEVESGQVVVPWTGALRALRRARAPGGAGVGPLRAA